MADEPDNGEEDEESFKTEEDSGGRDKQLSNSRVHLIFALILCCIIDYLVWAILGPCTSSNSARVYVWVVVTIVGVTTLAAIFLPLKDE